VIEHESLSILVSWVKLNLFRHMTNSYLIAFDDRYVNVGPFRDACLPVGMMDPAAFHQVLSNALLNISCRRADISPETNDCMKHHALAVKSVNERITDPKLSISDGFIGAIIGFACYYVRNAYYI